MKRTLILVSASFIIVSLLSCKNTTHNNQRNDNDYLHINEEIGDTILVDSLRLLFVGDIMVHTTQITAAKLPNGEFDFISPFDSIIPFFEDADIVIGNLETTLGDPPYTGYPRFRSPNVLVEQLKRVGFDILVTANNHAADSGFKGIFNTISKLDEAGIRSIGTFVDSTDRFNRTPLIIESNGIKAALLSYTYSTNGIPVPKPAEVSLIDTTVMFKEIERSKGLCPDITVVYMHWGEEYHTKPSKEQTELAKWLIDQDVDAIIGSHPHVKQPLIVDTLINGALLPIAYSLGNLISNQSSPGTQEGMMVELIIVKDERGVSIKGVNQINTYCNRNAERNNPYLIEVVR